MSVRRERVLARQEGAGRPHLRPACRGSSPGRSSAFHGEGGPTLASAEQPRGLSEAGQRWMHKEDGISTREVQTCRTTSVQRAREVVHTTQICGSYIGVRKSGPATHLQWDSSNAR